MKVHDYTSPTWGHDLVFRPRDDGMNASASGWGFGVSEGDIILIGNPDSPSGQAPYRVRRIEYYLNPPDMWRAELKFAPRDKDGKW